MGTFISTAPTESNCVYAGGTTLTAANQNISVTGLTGTEYLVICRVKDAGVGAGGQNVHLYLNSDTTDANYYKQQLTAAAAAVSSDRTNSSLMAVIDTSDEDIYVIHVNKTPDGYLCAQLVGGGYRISGTTPYLYNCNIIRTSATVSGAITAITLKNAAGANAWAIGSSIEVWELTTS